MIFAAVLLTRGYTSSNTFQYLEGPQDLPRLFEMFVPMHSWVSTTYDYSHANLSRDVSPTMSFSYVTIEMFSCMDSSRHQSCMHAKV